MSATGRAAKVLPFEFRYMWTIDNFSCHSQESQEANIKIESPKFTTGASDGPTFRLVLYPSSTNDSDFVSIFLELVEPGKHNRMYFNISIMRNKIMPLSKTDGPYQMIVVSRGFPKLLERKCLFDVRNGYLPDDKLTVLCEGSIIYDAVNISGRNIASPFTVPDCMVRNNLGLMFHGQKFSDVTFAVEGRELRAHKVILAAQSSVFAAMFEHDEMTERKENRVEIEDICFEVFEAMLRFIYTGKAKIDNKMPARLLIAAHEYQLDRLKVMCENKLATTLAADNAIDILIVADVHHAHQLKTLAKEFIVLRIHEFVEIARFKSLLQTHPLLGAETFQALAEKQTLEIPKTKK